MEWKGETGGGDKAFEIFENDGEEHDVEETSVEYPPRSLIQYLEQGGKT